MDRVAVITNPELALHILRLAEEGVTHRDIAEKVGCSRGSVWKVVKMAAAGHDFAAPPPQPKPQDGEHLRRVLRAGGFRWLPPAIAQRFYELERAPKNPRAFWRAA